MVQGLNNYCKVISNLMVARVKLSLGNHSYLPVSVNIFNNGTYLRYEIGINEKTYIMPQIVLEETEECKAYIRDFATSFAEFSAWDYKVEL